MNSKAIFELRFGRNVGDVPMSDGDWVRFQQLAQRTVSNLVEEARAVTGDADGSWVELHTGGGQWKGGGEESAVVTGYVPAVLADDDEFHRAVVHSLSYSAADLATLYRQDAVAFVWRGVSRCMQQWRSESWAHRADIYEKGDGLVVLAA